MKLKPYLSLEPFSADNIAIATCVAPVAGRQEGPAGKPRHREFINSSAILPLQTCPKKSCGEEERGQHATRITFKIICMNEIGPINKDV
jgi:hypothetical protein